MQLCKANSCQLSPASIAVANCATAAAGLAGWNALRLGVRGVGAAFKIAFGPMTLLLTGLTLGADKIIENRDKIQPYFEELWVDVKNTFNAVLE